MKASLQAVCAAAALIELSAAAPADRAAVSYDLSPVLVGGELASVVVEVRLRGDADGETVIELPDASEGQTERWRRFGPIEVTGATSADDGPARRVLRAAPGAPIRLRYRVTSGYDADPRASEGPYRGPAIRPAWFASQGEYLFVKPRGRGRDAARFTWSGWPASWRHASDADHWRMGRAMTVDDVLESSLLAGPDVELRERAITSGTLRLASRGRWSFGGHHYADLVARIVSAQRSFWGDVRGPFTVTLFQFPAEKGRSSAGGTGRSDGFTLFATPDIPEENLLFIIAHEHVHTWIPRRLGTMPEPDEIAGYWLSEGFTDFYAQRTLLRSGIWTPEQFIADLNRVLFEYATSPARAYPNGRIVSGFWNDPDILYLPYRRGTVFAYLADHALRRASGGRRDLDTVVFAMRDRWAAAGAGARPAVVESFAEAATAAGFDPRPQLARNIEAGEPILLPANLFPGCVSVATAEVPVFDAGFDPDKSAETGRITGVDTAGPAYAAGLRDGMKRLGRVGGKEGDSRVEVGYRVVDAGGERVISYRPEGKTRVVLQEAVMAPALSAAARAACIASMSGGR